MRIISQKVSSLPLSFLLSFFFFWSLCLSVTCCSVFPTFLLSAVASLFYFFLLCFSFSSCIYLCPALSKNISCSPQITWDSPCMLINSMPSPTIGSVWVGAGVKLFSLLSWVPDPYNFTSLPTWVGPPGSLRSSGCSVLPSHFSSS